MAFEISMSECNVGPAFPFHVYCGGDDAQVCGKMLWLVSKGKLPSGPCRVT